MSTAEEGEQRDDGRPTEGTVLAEFLVPARRGRISPGNSLGPIR